MTSFSLGCRAIHVWLVALDQSWDRGIAALSADEAVRAEKYRFDAPRESFTRCRVALRHLLGQYLSVSPSDVRFEYAVSRKPGLTGNSSLHFNLSHSGDFALIAVARVAPVGVDIERVRALTAQEMLENRIFSAAELDQLRRLPETQRRDGFFAGWTRKEALLKAHGDGLRTPLTSVEVCLDPRRDPKILRSKSASIHPREWTLWTLAAPAGYHASLAVRSSEPQVDVTQVGDDSTYRHCFPDGR
ncbi:4'-phosphopantetheinyl transferase psf-1 [Planctomycetes bacterium Pan216]|uniref:4'-phosphopantetheinyl transferase psf-1 n=1 Tax=Kolteria novifilia TaxID=2527975 RepID=A0A518AXA5_9BACT|nr:4'-phosphopantetheinyl transferase psf-1 [Planctomycetes bacterium Pan216]